MTPSSKSPAPDPGLAQLRARIDAVDEHLLGLLNERAGLAREVGELKRTLQPEAPFYAPAREREVLGRLAALNPGPFPTAALRPVFQEIMGACLSLERPLRVAFLGPEGTFTHQAVKHQFGLSVLALPQGSIPTVFQAVERGQADYGVVPVENATEGVVDSTLDTFLDSPLRITAEILLPVDQALLLRHDLDLAQVQRVYSHPQALGQCQRWLATHLPQAVQVAAFSTAEAARLAHEDAEGAAVASELAAKLFDLRVGAESIQDLTGNATRFLVLGPTIAPTRPGPHQPGGHGQGWPRGAAPPAGAPGRRAEPLPHPEPAHPAQGLGARLLPGRGRPRAGRRPSLEALTELRKVTAGVKLLGSYPRAQEVQP